MSSMLIDSLRQTAMLAYVRFSCPTSIRRDRSMDGALADRANVTGAAAFRASKNIFAGADEQFHAAKKVQDRFRAYVMANTLPYGRNGARLLENSKFMEFAGAAAAARRDQDQAVNALVDNLDACKAKARQMLGLAYDEADYPGVDGLRRLFVIDVDFHAIPDTGGFSDALPASTREQLEALVLRKARAKFDHAVADIREQAEDVAKRLEASLSDPDRRLIVTSFERAGAVAAMLSSIIAADPDASDALSEAASKLRWLSEQDVDAMRVQSPAAPESERAKAAAVAAALVSDLACFA